MSLPLSMLYLLSFSLAYGLADMCWMMLGTRVPFFKSLVYRGVISVLVTFLFAMLLAPGKPLDFFDLLAAAGTGFLAVIAFLLFYKSLQQEASGINAVVTKGLTSVVAVSLVMYLAKEINYKIILALAVLIIGLLFLNNDKEKRKVKVSIHAIGAGVLWGVAFVLFEKHVNEIGSFWFAFTLEFTLLVAVLAIYMFKKKEHSFRYTKYQLFMLLFIGLVTAAGSVLNTYAYNYFTPAVITIVAKFAVLPPFLYAIIILKQKLSWQKLIGLLVILFAIYLCL